MTEKNHEQPDPDPPLAGIYFDAENPDAPPSFVFDREAEKRERDRLWAEQRERTGAILESPLSDGAKLCGLLIEGGHTDKETLMLRLQAPHEFIERFLDELENWNAAGE